MVEVIVALLIAVNVLTILWQVFIADQRRFNRDQGKLSAMQGALVFAERLEADLREIALRVRAPGGTDFRYTLDDPIQFEDSGRRISFLVFKPEEAASIQPAAERVTYALDPVSFRMVRQSPRETHVFRGSLVDAVRFEGKSVTLALASLATPTRLFRPDVPVWLLKYQITTSPETPGAATPAEVPAEHKVTLVNSVPLVYRSDRTNHPYWSPNGSELALEAP